MSRKKKLSDILYDSLSDTNDIIIIEWNRRTGNYRLHFRGQPMSTRAIDSLLKSISDLCKKYADDVGIIEFTKEKPSKDESNDEAFTPPWEN